MAQGLLQLPTTGTVSGLQNNQDANAALGALAAMMQGGAAPTPESTGLASIAGVWWHDTANNLVKLRDQADSAWIVVGAVDEANKTLIPYYRNAPLVGFLRGALAGCQLSNDPVAPTTKIDIAAGLWVDDTNSFAATPDATAIDFATTGAGGLDSGALAANIWYHCFAIATPGGVAAGFASTSLTPTLPAGYSYKRRLGSVKTDASGHLLPFVQFGDYFYWANAISSDIDTTIGRTPANFAVNVPPGVNVLAHIQSSSANNSGNTTSLRIYDVALADVSLSSSTDSRDSLSISVVSGTGNLARVATQVWVRTSTSQQVRVVADVGGTGVTLTAIGWIDYRGKLN